MPKDAGGGRSDESVQFSLKELLKLEDDRIVRQEEQRSIERARHEERRLAEEAATKRAAEVEAAERQRRALDELARREALQKAIVEQARLEVDVRSRANERELERRHEIEVARLRREGARTGFAGLVGAAVVGGVVVMLVAGGLHFAVFAPSAARRLAESDERAASSDARARDLAMQLDDTHRAKLRLEREVAEARAVPTQVSPPRPTPARPPRRASPSPSSGAHPTTDPCGGPGDPMCPTIGR